MKIGPVFNSEGGERTSISGVSVLCQELEHMLSRVILLRTLWNKDSSVGKESTCNAGDPGSIPRLGRSPGEGIGYPLQYSWASLVAQLVKNPPAMWETWARSLGRNIPWRRERLPTPVFWPGEFHGLHSPWCRRVRFDWVTFTFIFTNE